MKAFVIGGATLDTIIHYEDMETMTYQGENFRKSYMLLSEGSKIEVTAQEMFSGGGATNTAVSFKKQGFEVMLFCKMAKDAAGEFILKECQSYGIDISVVRFSQTEGTANSFVVPTLSGDRTLFAYRGANATLLNSEIPIDAIRSADFIYITSLSRASAKRLPDIVDIAEAVRIPVAVNPGISQLKKGSNFLEKALSGIDILITNYEEAEAFMQSLSGHEDDGGTLLSDEQFTLRAYFKKILSMGPNVVVITNGSEGVYVATKNQLFFHPIQKTKIVNTLGAGDAFGSSFVGSYYLGDGIENAIRAGVANSASVVGYNDSKSGLLNREEILHSIQKISADLLDVC